MTENVEANRVRWRCRRGMRELDQLMLRYLERRWAVADDKERGVFLRLLDCEDDNLWRWCMGRERPDDWELHEFVQILVNLPH